MNNPAPQGKYVIATRWENLIWTAGLTPRINGVMQKPGKIMADAEDLSSYREIVATAAENALAAVRSKLCDGEKIAGILSMTVYIAAESSFTAHAKFADMASEYLYEKLGQASVCARVSVGVASLPGDAPLEIQLVAGVQKV